MPRYTTAQLERALIDCKGMVYVAAGRLGCSPTTIKKRLLRTPTLQAALDGERGKMGDTAELKLFQAVQQGDPWAIQFYLKTQCKTRGYVSRDEVSGPDGGPIEVADVSDRDRIASRMDELAERRRARELAQQPIRHGSEEAAV